MPVYVPGWSLWRASFEVIPPPHTPTKKDKLGFAAKKWKFPTENCCFWPWPAKIMAFFSAFFSRRSRLSITYKLAWPRKAFYLATFFSILKASRFRLSLNIFLFGVVEVRFFKQKIGHTKVIVVYSWLLRLIVHVKINLRSCIRCHWIARNLIFHFLKT